MENKFILPKGGPYFLTHSVGPMTVRGRENLEALYLAPWGEEGGHAFGIGGREEGGLAAESVVGLSGIVSEQTVFIEDPRGHRELGVGHGVGPDAGGVEVESGGVAGAHSRGVAT